MDLADRNLSLEKLLTQIVRSEIQAFQSRQADRRLTKVLGFVEGLTIDRASNHRSLSARSTQFPQQIFL
ncbi:hypothetical protein [Chamaesiphon sp. VAR_48_metabat_135_sub]|uniref:hypothetical protein n=1 Tax=Chamaesiphon sp. VAR_48_metabat_135_sub TaxID=2964699 RepID=UPI00286AC5E7|nr:hypothetical protein [Chamaesiphon sp. VAR_48_metabat_135_sub]